MLNSKNKFTLNSNKILIIDPALTSVCQEGVDCVHEIVKEFSIHPEFASSEILYFAPNFQKKRLSSFLKNLNISMVISLGSHANITDQMPFVDELAEDLQVHILAKNIPFFGICFSHQLFAYIHGLKVDYLKNKHAVPDGKYLVFRTFSVLHPKLALLATQMQDKDYYSDNALDLNFKEILKITASWEDKNWHNMSIYPDWKLTPQEYRIKRFIENYSSKTMICHARHEQEVWEIPCPQNPCHLALAAESSGCQVEALVHTKHPAYTFQTHVETRHPSRNGYLVLKNFIYMSALCCFNEIR